MDKSAKKNSTAIKHNIKHQPMQKATSIRNAPAESLSVVEQGREVREHGAEVLHRHPAVPSQLGDVLVQQKRRVVHVEDPPTSVAQGESP